MILKNIFMIKTCLLIVFTFIGLNGFSQIVSSDIVPASGNTFVQPTLTMDWTLGDLSIETYKNNNITLTQGFQQGNLLITKIEDNISISNSIKVYPNPAKSIVNIEITDFSNIIYYELFSPDGKQILNGSINSALETIDLSAFANGLYFLKIISNSDNKAKQVFKIQKIR